MKHSRPNVLLIYTDQQRLDSLSCYNPMAITPNLDALAKEGVRFDQHFSNSPVCMPSRMSLLTGRYPSSLGIGQNGYSLPSDAVPINQLLKPYGYDTAQIGKLHFNTHAKRNHKNPTDHYGFDRFILSDEPGCYDDAYTKWVEQKAPDEVDKIRTGLPPAAFHYNQTCYSTQARETHEPYTFKSDMALHHSDFVSAETCQYIREKSFMGQAFFAIAGFYAPHTPVNPPQEFLDMYDVTKMPLPIKGKEEKWLPELEGLSVNEWQSIVAHYLALVTHTDHCIGEIIKTLKETGQYEETLIVFTSDHGEFLGDHGRIQKGMPYDCILNVPLIVSYPEKVDPRVVDCLTEAVDIVPTILDFCGVQQPDYVQGLSMKSLMLGHVFRHRDHVFAEHFDHKGMHISMVRDKKNKHVLWSDGSETLYDLVTDPHELEDMARNTLYSNVVSTMRLKHLKAQRNALYKCYEMEAEY